MKTASSLKIGFSTLVGVALLSGCCRSTNCDCVFPSVGIFYESDTLTCPNDFQVMAFDQANNQNMGEAINLLRDDCSLEFSYEANRYWVISSDSLNISDTVRITDISFFENDDDCCDCGPQISGIELDINGQRSAGNAPVRKF